jgi:hypothetical protein
MKEEKNLTKLQMSRLKNVNHRKTTKENSTISGFDE